MGRFWATDSTAAILYRNNRDGTFTDTALESGSAYGAIREVRKREWEWPSATSTATGGSTS